MRLSSRPRADAPWEIPVASAQLTNGPTGGQNTAHMPEIYIRIVVLVRIFGALVVKPLVHHRAVLQDFGQDEIPEADGRDVV